MKVKARFQIAYDNKIINGGEEFDIRVEDLDEYRNDIIPVTFTSQVKTKPVKLTGKIKRK